ncbi:FAD-dependent oxidoreductase [Chloroflexota bacterium]
MLTLKRLFEPSRIGKLELKNRLIMAAMGTSSADDGGYVTERMIDYFAERARGGVGLIISGITMVDSKAPGRSGTPAIYDDKYLSGWKRLAEVIHLFGGKMAVQLGHHGILMSNPERRQGFKPEEIDTVGPSLVPFLLSNVTARAASENDIAYLVESFAQAVKRVQDAGLDAVEFHCAHGKLISQFLSPFFNKRTDAYGGTPEKRARFACEIIMRTRGKVGPDFPLLVRINGEDGFEGGITLSEGVLHAALLAEAGADAIDVSSLSDSFSRIIPGCADPPGLFVPLAEAVKKAVHVPVVVVGKLGDPLLAERVLRERKADFIALGRPLLADPDLPNKAREGRLDEIRRCITCNNCLDLERRFVMRKTTGRALGCTVNPTLLRERSFSLRPVSFPKKVMVIGGGLAGMKAATDLAGRGHMVSLYEKDNSLGGQWNIACQIPWKKEYAALTEYLVRGITKTKVNVILGQKVTRDLVQSIQPDVVVLAAGAIPATLDVPGADGRNVVQANDVLARNVKLGERVAIIGGRLRGMETACLLTEEGKKVSLITKRNLGRETNKTIYWPLREKIVRYGVPVYSESQVLQINENGVSILTNHEVWFIPADTVVIAVGSKSDNNLVDQLKGIMPEIHIVGDCLEPRSALEAVNQATEVASTI